jgi:hypothetical protein
MNRVAVPAGVVGKRAAVPRMFTKPMNDRPMPMAKHLEGLLATFDQRVPDSAGMLWRGEEPSANLLRYSMVLRAKEAREDQWDSCGGS